MIAANPFYWLFRAEKSFRRRFPHGADGKPEGEDGDGKRRKAGERKDWIERKGERK